MELKQICKEIIKEARKKKVDNLKDFNNLKLKVLQKFKYKTIPKNATIAAAASKKEKEELKNVLSMKPVRTAAGVAPIALMTDPYPCPHTIKKIGPCTYCPGGPGSSFGDVPQSYTGKEPSTRRAIRNLYDPYLGTFNRIEHYIAMGSSPEKADVILQGGTFPFMPYNYQEYFVKYLLKAMNDFSRLFYTKQGINKKKFNLFFELPANIESVTRTENVHKKTLFVKNLNLKSKKTLNTLNKLFFDRNSKNVDEELIKKWNNFSIEKYKKFGFLTKKDKKETLEKANLRVMRIVRDKASYFDNKDFSLEEMQKDNETAKIRCIGLTIETKSDYGKLSHGNSMLKLGCTRVELGIQSVYEKPLKITHRGNTVKDNIESIQVLKDLGFKINAHYMPGLPGTTKVRDKKGLKDLFLDEDYKPDMLKVYPAMVMPGTKLLQDYESGTFKPLSTKEAALLIAEMFSHTPEYCRVMRVQRDIPTYATKAGVDKTNLRQYVEQLMKQKGIVSKDIRAREVGTSKKKANLKNMEIKTTEYKASKGKEFFIQAFDKKTDALFGFIRLRFPSQFLRGEITKKSALVRELHIYSAALEIGTRSKESFQHQGIGKQLLKKAEEVALENKKDKIVIISGIGVREYFRKFKYKLEGPYMVKKI